MTDRKRCKMCVHSYFETNAAFKWCNYLEDTGMRRPHEGDICYGFEKKTDMNVIDRKRNDIVITERGK